MAALAILLTGWGLVGLAWLVLSVPALGISALTNKTKGGDSKNESQD